jgi:hypothetical protein
MSAAMPLPALELKLPAESVIVEFTLYQIDDLGPEDKFLLYLINLLRLATLPLLASTCNDNDASGVKWERWLCRRTMTLASTQM